MAPLTDDQVSVTEELVINTPLAGAVFVAHPGGVGAGGLGGVLPFLLQAANNSVTDKKASRIRFGI